MIIVLKNVRLSFAQLWEAKPFANDPKSKPAFSANFLMTPDHPALKEVRNAINEVAKEKWVAKAAVTLKAIEAKDDSCLHDGDMKPEYDGFPGNLYLSARSYVRPKVVDRNKADLVEADGRPYSGCYVNASVDIWAQDNSYGKRVNATLVGVQFVKDGDAFAGGPAPSADAFDDISEGADAEELV